MIGVAQELRVEHLGRPLGLLDPAPRFSWQLPGGAARQLAYRLRADNGWDTGRVASHRSLLVGYAGDALTSAQRVTWQVKVWTDLGEHEWSEPAWFETGLMSTSDWTAVVDLARTRWVRGVFDVGRPISRARLYITAHGIYEAFLNGVRVGDAELTPGYTQYARPASGADLRRDG